MVADPLRLLEIVMLCHGGAGILVGNADHPALLLGPLAVAPDRTKCGIGRALMFKTLDLAAQLGHDLVLLVGDVDYYQRFGFVPATPHGFVMPGEARPDRLQVGPLKDDVLGHVAGDIRHIHRRLPAIRATTHRILRTG